MILKSRMLIFMISCCVFLSSCISKKAHELLQQELLTANADLGKAGVELNECMNKLSVCEQEKEKLKGEVKSSLNVDEARNNQISDLQSQIADLRAARDRQLEQVGDLTALSKSANDNIKETLMQMERKDKYIQLIQAAKTKADSINLALAINLKGVLTDGVTDEDVEIKVDKTVVLINLSDKMLFESGQTMITPRAQNVLGKIAKIIDSRPELEVMVDRYTDDVPIKSSCMNDNWDLSVKRATSVVRVLQEKYNVDPNKLIAAGRGQYNALADNATPEGRSTNRRTRIIIMPKLNQFYDLLNPELAAGKSG